MILKFHTFPPSMLNFSSDTLKNLREIPFLVLFNASPMFSQLKTSVALFQAFRSFKRPTSVENGKFVLLRILDTNFLFFYPLLECWLGQKNCMNQLFLTLPYQVYCIIFTYNFLQDEDPFPSCNSW